MYVVNKSFKIIHTLSIPGGLVYLTRVIKREVFIVHIN